MPHRHTSDRGFTLAALIIFLTAASILLAAGVPAYQRQMQREMEEELIFRAQEYVRAILKYERQNDIYPPDLDALFDTNGIRYLRKEYTDPFTGAPFRLLTVNGDGTIEGSSIYDNLMDGGGMFQGMDGQTFGESSSEMPSASIGTTAVLAFPSMQAVPGGGGTGNGGGGEGDQGQNGGDDSSSSSFQPMTNTGPGPFGGGGGDGGFGQGGGGFGGGNGGGFGGGFGDGGGFGSSFGGGTAGQNANFGNAITGGGRGGRGGGGEGGIGGGFPTPGDLSGSSGFGQSMGGFGPASGGSSIGFGENGGFPQSNAGLSPSDSFGNASGSDTFFSRGSQAGNFVTTRSRDVRREQLDSDFGGNGDFGNQGGDGGGGGNPFNGGGGGSNQPNFGAGGIVGVAPDFEGPSLKVYNERETYEEWEFIAIPGYGTVPVPVQPVEDDGLGDGQMQMFQLN